MASAVAALFFVLAFRSAPTTAAPAPPSPVALPAGCPEAAGRLTRVDRKAWVAFEKAGLYSEPKVCPGGTDCPWQRKGYVVRGDELEEVAVIDVGQPPTGLWTFSCVTFRTTSGWVKTSEICLPPQPRRTRAEPLVVDRIHQKCPAARTVATDEAFFSGSFTSDTARLEAAYIDGRRVRYKASLAEAGCHETVSGIATIDGLVATAPEGTTLAFADDGVDLKFGPATACPALEKEFFFDPGGTRLAPNGCDLNAAGVDKQDFVSLYYKLKGAMARDDRAAVASLVKYPLTIGRGRARRQIRNASGFVTNYDAIVNGCIKATVQRQKMGQLFCRDQGVMFGDGAVWVSNGPTDLQVITLNQDACIGPRWKR